MDETTRQQDAYRKKIITIPNLLSFFRLALIPVIVWMYCVKEKYVMTGCLLILSGATDLVDGYVARRFHMITDLGKVLDPIADKLTQAAMLLCLFLRYPLMLLPFLCMLVKEIFMAVTGLLVIKKTGKVFGANWHGKVATCLLYAMMILHVFWYAIPKTMSDAMIYLCTGMILVSFVLYAVRNFQAIKEQGETQD